MTYLTRLGALATIGLAALLWPSAVRAASAPYSGIVVFGDSLSDTGNVLAANGGQGPDAPYARGRFSNGAVWIEHVADALGLAVDPALGGGTNYAFGGARTGPAGSEPPSLLDQVGLHLGARGGRGADPDALHVVLGGANDLLPLMGQPQRPADAAAAVPADNVETVVRRLAEAGARRFLVINMPDLGATPAARAQGPAAEARGTALARAFNDRLAAALDRLEGRFPIEIIRIDLFDLHRAVLAEPAAYGFDSTAEPCLTGAGICAAPERHLFWDDVHPTAAAHARLGAAVLDVLGTAVEGAAGEGRG